MLYIALSVVLGFLGLVLYISSLSINMKSHKAKKLTLFFISATLMFMSILNFLVMIDGLYETILDYTS